MSDEQDTTPLLLALQNLKGEVCEDVVNLLVRGGADVNHRKSNGREVYGIFVFLFFNVRIRPDLGVTLCTFTLQFFIWFHPKFIPYT